MINNIKEFENIHPYAVIVNYDIATMFGYGITYRTSTKSLESFCKIDGKYITYPYIQPYLKLDDSKYELFIIKDKKMFKLKRSLDGINYSISNEVKVNSNIYMDDVFYDLNNVHESIFVKQDLLKII